MSDRIGPMAWGSQGAVFLGEDLMHTRDYSDETSRVIPVSTASITVTVKRGSSILASRTLTRKPDQPTVTCRIDR